MNYFSLVERSRLERRIVVVATYAAFALALLLAPYGKADGLLWLRAAAIGLAVTGAAGYAAILGYSKRFAVRSQRCEHVVPDEREAAVRDRAMARAYTVVAVATIIGGAWMWIAADDPRHWTPRTGTDWFEVLVVTQVVMGSLPQAMIAWGEPDADEGTDGVMVEGLQ